MALESFPLSLLTGVTYLKNNTLAIAVASSVVLHGVLLAVHFVAPVAVKFEPADPTLEVVLVNAKHASKPLKAEALAQANLDGGGNADLGRAKSPLPDMRRTQDGESIKQAQRRIEELQERQDRLLAQMKKTPFATAPVKDGQKLDQPAPQNGRDTYDAQKALARMAAEISQTIDDQNKRPRKTYITPSTREVGYAMYYNTLQKKIEEVGTLNFPQDNGKKLYGEMTVTIPVFQDGSIFERDGGPRVDKSSGNKALDAAALRIVRRAAPFGRFPANMRSGDKDDVWVVVTRFKFTREERMTAELRGTE